jgi:hypothetical protein
LGFLIDGICLGRFHVHNLKRAHIHLSSEEDELAWDFNAIGGVYSAKLGYLSVISEEENIQLWWFKKLWKIQNPSKSLLFLWLMLKERVLTWDMLQKRALRVQVCVICVKLMDNLISTYS